MKGKELLRKELKYKIILEARLRLILEAEKNVAGKTDKFVKELKKTKEEFDKCFDRLIEEAEKKADQTRIQTDKEVSAMKTSLEVLNSIQENLEAEDTTNSDTITNYREAVRAIIEKNKTNISDTRSFKFPVFNTDGVSTEMIADQIVWEDHVLELPDYGSEESKVKDRLPAQIGSSQPLCTGISLNFINLIYFSFVPRYSQISNATCAKSSIQTRNVSPFVSKPSDVLKKNQRQLTLSCTTSIWHEMTNCKKLHGSLMSRDLGMKLNEFFIAKTNNHLTSNREA